MNILGDIKSDLRALANKDKAKLLAGFFKTGPGQYGEGDVFLGITVPQQRKVAKKYHDLSLGDAVKLLHSKEHEFRLTALLILVDKYECAGNVAKSAGLKKKIFDIYLANTKWINNWDLVDLSAPRVVGEWVANEASAANKILTKLAHSPNLWERRIAILATFAYIKKGDHKPAFKIAKILLHDEHDLIHKAVGWMLREVGKRCGNGRGNVGYTSRNGTEKSARAVEISFLDKYASVMPRTMLRYAIERFPEGLRKKYLSM